MPIPESLRPAIAPEKRWHVVVVGSWNPAIFTPKGIARRLFELDENTPINVEVSLDAVAPNRVQHQGVTVAVDNRQLLVQAAANDFGSLAAAGRIAKLAVTDLPQTPLIAAGYNAIFNADEDDTALARLWTSECDDRLVRSGHSVAGKSLSRTVSFKDGEVAVVIVQKQGEPYDVIVSIHRKSADMPELQRWLTLTAEDIETEAASLVNVFASLPAHVETTR